MHSLYIKLIFWLILISSPNLENVDAGRLKYEVNSPEACNLDKDLIEISGLTYDTEKDCFYAINDEEGIIFAIKHEPCQSKVINNFKKDGDYEGIEKVGRDIYVLESKGKLYKYHMGKGEVTDTYKTDLDERNDSEGLALDLKTNSLLIACKGDHSLDLDAADENIHAIYRFDLELRELIREPWMLIADDTLFDYYASELTYFKWIRSKLAENRFNSFAPSAVAINPIDDKIYILSTRGKMLVVMTRDQKVDHIYYLDNGAYIQPEGITFDSQGNMYISNEGKGYKGNLLKISR